MKKETKLVIEIVRYLAAKHPNMSFKYGYVPLIGHAIEVGPLEMFENFEEYGIDEVDAKMEFITKFPDKGLMFFNSDPFVEIENPILEISPAASRTTPKGFVLSSKTLWSNLGRALGF